MEWFLETLAIVFVFIASVWFVVAQAYGILNGVREYARGASQKNFAEAPSVLNRTRKRICGLVCGIIPVI